MAAKIRAKRASKGGRPSSFDPQYVKQAFNLCLLGATNEELARSFGVVTSTIDKWIADLPEFSGAVKRGREEADAKVAKSLYRRALGYSHKAVKILTVAIGDNQGSEVREVPYIERYAPDTGAAMAWLKNRQPDKWRDKREVEITDSRADRIAAARKRLLSREPVAVEPVVRAD